MEMSARKPLLPRRVLDLPIDALRPNPNQPRIEFDEASLRSLSDSIRRYGILQPLTVRRTDEGYELIAGERRLRAAKLAGLREVPCLLARSSEEESALLALIENLQRRDLHYLEEAAAIARLIATYDLSQEQAAERLGKSQSAIANKLRLLRLSPDCVRLLREHDLSERHARALLRLTNEEDRLKALQVIAARGYNVAQSEAYIEELLKLKQKTPPPRLPTYIVKDVRIFLNTIRHSLGLMQRAGVEADMQREDTDDGILLTIRIPKRAKGRIILQNCHQIVILFLTNCGILKRPAGKSLSGRSEETGGASMDEMNGAFEEKKRRKGGKRLMQPEKAAKAAKEPRAEKPPRVPRETSGKTGKVVGIVAGVLVVAYLGLGAWASASHKIYPNVMMGDTNYGGMTEQQVAEQLKASVAQAKGAGVDFVLPDGTEVAHVSLDAMPEYVDFDGLAKHIYNVYGCNDSFLTAGAKYLRALFKPQDAAQVVDAAYSPDLMENLVDTVCDSINCDPVEFAINVTEDGKVSVTKPQDGRATTDTAKDQIGVYLNGAYLSGGDPSEIVLEPASEGGVYDVIPAQEVDLSAQREAVIGQKVNATYDKETGAVTPGHAGVEFTLSDLESAYNAAAAGETVDLPNATVETPDVTAEQLQKVLFRDVLSTYTTKVGGASGRRANVKLTASRITGYILNSGETMKYGPLVTPFTAANGYSTAPGYLQGKTVDMVGGGACQASSTLYAAALYANLEIVQRTNHGFASDYIGLGLDATVAQGGPEFEFRNNTNYPIKVVAEYYASGGKNYLKVSLLGTKVDDTYVKIKTDVLETIPFSEQIVETDELAPGERKVEQTAYTGYKVKTYRNVYSGDGKLISSTFEASSNYKARNRIVLVGKSAAVTPTDPITPVDPGTTTPTDPTTPVDPGTTTNPGTTTDPGVTDPGTTTEPPVEQEKPSWLDTGLDR